MVRHLRVGIVGKDPALVLDDRFGIDGGGHRTSHKDFGHDLRYHAFIEFDRPVFGNGGIGEIVNLGTRSAHSAKGIAGLANVGGLARRVNQTTETFRGIDGASNIGLTRIVRDIASLLDEFIGTGVIATVTAAGLDGEVKHT